MEVKPYANANHEIEPSSNTTASNMTEVVLRSKAIYEDYLVPVPIFNDEQFMHTLFYHMPY